MDLKDIVLPQYISTVDKSITVAGLIDGIDKKYTDGKGYIDEDGYIWIFSKKGKPKLDNPYPYFWISDNKLEYSNPSETIKEDYNASKMKDLNIVNIIDKTNEGEELLDDEFISSMNSSSSFYVPVINDNDDFLKKLVKYTIIKKNKDINALKYKTDKKYVLANMRAALENSTKMSVKYFQCWMELLGCSYHLEIRDSANDTSVQKLKEPIEYDSESNRVYDDVDTSDIVATTSSSDE